MSAAHLVAYSLAVQLTAAPSYAQECLPREAEATGERARRQAAVDYVVAVNAAQALAQKKAGRYVSFNELAGLPSVPVGLIPRVIVDQWSYMVSLKDFFDTCGYALFSDERGVIYEAHARAAASQGPKDTAEDK